MSEGIDIRVPLLATDPAQDRVLEEFLSKGKVKNAIDHIDKRLKKSRKEQHTRLQVMKILLDAQRDRVASLGSNSQDFMRRHMDALVDIAPQIAADDACVETLESVGKGVWAAEFWQKTTDLHSDNEIFEIWFDTQFRKAQYNEAAKAIGKWRRFFPKRAPELNWRLIVCYDLAADGRSVASVTAEGALGIGGAARQSTDSMLKAARFRDALIMQAVNNTPVKNEKASTIRNQADLELICSIYRRTGRGALALDILDNDDKGLRSIFGNATLAISKLDILRELNKADESRLFARQMIEDVVEYRKSGTQHWNLDEAGDDISFLSHLVNTSTSDEYDRLVVLLKGLVAGGESVNGDWALTLLHFRNSADKIALQAAKDFWSKYASKGKAIDLQIQDHVPTQIRERFLEFVSEASLKASASLDDPRSAVNLIAQARGLLMHWSDHASSARFEPIVVELIGIWDLTRGEKKIPADNGMADEAMVLAARMCIAMGAQVDRYPDAISHARLILELLVRSSKHNFSALTLLVRICLFQGAATKAMGYYHRLDIKNLQFVTESAGMFQNIGNLHPLPVARKSYDPLTVLRRMRDWLAKRGRSYDNFVMEAVEESSWTTALQQIEMKSECFMSPAAILVNMEISRIANRGRVVIDQVLVASAESFLVQAASTMAKNNDLKALTVVDAVSKEYPDSSSILNLATRLPRGSLFDSFLTIIVHNEVRHLIQRDPPKLTPSVLQQLGVDNYNHLACLYGLPLAILQSNKTLVVGGFQGLDKFLDIIIGETAQLDCKFFQHATPGALLVNAYNTLDSIRVLDELVSWIKADHPPYKQQAVVLEGKISTLKVAQARLSWLDQVDDESSTGVSSTDCYVGRKLRDIVGESGLRRLDNEYLDSVRDALEALVSLQA